MQLLPLSFVFPHATGVVSKAMSRRIARCRRPHLLLCLLAVGVLSGGAGAAPTGGCPCPEPKPGQVLSSPFPRSVSLYARTALERPDGSVVVAGTLQVGPQHPGSEPTAALALGGFRVDGRPAASFGARGSSVRSGAAGYPYIDALAAQPDGRILVGGWDGTAPFVARHTADGELDETFGVAGIVRGARPVDTLGATTLALRALGDGTIAVVQAVRQPVDTDRSAPGGLVFLRLRPDGKAITTAFYSAPEFTPNRQNQYAGWADGSVQADGSIVVAGSVPEQGPSEESHQIFIVRRFHADGSVDRSFGQGGRTLTKIGTDTYAYDLAVAPDGSLLVSGTSGSSGGTFAVARYLPDGLLDRSFGSSGTFALSFGDERGVAERVAFASDGGVVLAGPPGLIVRLDRNGRLDTSFGDGGRTPFTGSRVAGLLPEADGGIRVAGSSGSAFRLHRVTRDGVVDAAFGENEAVAGLSPRGVNAVAARRRGDAVLAGWIDSGRGRIAAHIVRTRFPTSGNEFGRNGEVTVQRGRS